MVISQDVTRDICGSRYAVQIIRNWRNGDKSNGGIKTAVTGLLEDNNGTSCNCGYNGNYSNIGYFIQ